MKWYSSAMNSLCQSVHDLSPDCKHAVHTHAAALNQRVPFRQRIGLRVHLLLCDWCRRHTRNVEFLRGAMDQNERPAPRPFQLSPEAKERIRQRLDAK